MTIALVVAGSLTLGVVGVSTAFAADGGTAAPALTATLDGKPIALEDVGKYYCDDFSYPEIRCWSTRVLADTRATLVTLLTSVDYVTIYDLAGFQGASMSVSEDYAALSLIGWNDRISSFRGRNSESGAFYTDWFYSGNLYGFCCNSQIANLGSFNNTFSSIQRT